MFGAIIMNQWIGNPFSDSYSSMAPVIHTVQLSHTLFQPEMTHLVQAALSFDSVISTLQVMAG